jgi:hypothetical protein
MQPLPAIKFLISLPPALGLKPVAAKRALPTPIDCLRVALKSQAVFILLSSNCAQ